jgi:hypothetical protein
MAFVKKPKHAQAAQKEAKALISQQKASPKALAVFQQIDGLMIITMLPFCNFQDLSILSRVSKAFRSMCSDSQVIRSLYTSLVGPIGQLDVAAAKLALKKDSQKQMILRSPFVMRKVAKTKIINDFVKKNFGGCTRQDQKLAKTEVAKRWVDGEGVRIDNPSLFAQQLQIGPSVVTAGVRYGFVRMYD